MEQESTIHLEELTDMQAFDQSPKHDGMIIVSQEKGFKSFLDNKLAAS